MKRLDGRLGQIDLDRPNNGHGSGAVGDESTLLHLLPVIAHLLSHLRCNYGVRVSNESLFVVRGSATTVPGSRSNYSMMLIRISLAHP